MLINISSPQYRLLKGTLTLIEMSPSDAAEGLQITRAGKFLLLLADLTLDRRLDNTSIFVSVLSPVVIEVTDEELQAGTLRVNLPPQKLFRIRLLDRGGSPAANQLVSYQNLRDVPTAWYTVRADKNGEVLLCGVNTGSYFVGSPECDPVHVVVEDSDLDDREIILQPRA